jgi:hypothetical protein
MACVYVLYPASSPDDIRYVGRVKIDAPDARLKVHIQDVATGKKYHIHNWIRKVQEAGDTIVVRALETNLSWSESAQREIYYIAHYRSLGFNLTNMTSGGDGAPDLPQEVRLTKSAKLRGQKRSQETCAKISASLKGKPGKPCSPEAKAKISLANKNKIVLPETKAKISLALRVKLSSNEECAKRSKAWKSRVVSKETRLKMSKAHKDRKKVLP